MWFVVLCLIWSAVSANVVQRGVRPDHSVLFVGEAYVGKDLTRIVVYYDVGVGVNYFQSSVFPHADPGDTIDDFVYVNRMRRLYNITATVTASEVSKINVVSLEEATLLVNVYNTDFLFYGPPPHEFLPHMESPLCGSRVSFGSNGMVVPVTLHGPSGISSVGEIRYNTMKHAIATAGICGMTRMVFGVNSVERYVWIDCSPDASAVSTGTNVLSGIQLNLGIHFRVINSVEAEVCFYAPDNDEINHLWAVAVIAVMLVFLSVWLWWGWVIDMRVLMYDKNSKVRLWKITSVAYYSTITSFVVFLINLNMYSTVHGAQHMNRLSSVRMTTRYTVYAMSAMHSYVVCPFVGAVILFCFTVGNVLYRPESRADPHSGAWFTWDLDFLGKRPLRFRLFFSAVVFFFIGGGIWLVWGIGLGDTRGAIVSILSLIPLIIQWSNPNKLSVYIFNHHNRFYDISDIMIIFVRWGFEWLVLSTIYNFLPFDVSGTLATRFSNGVGFVLGPTIIAITARDFAAILVMLIHHQLHRLLFLAVVVLQPLLFYVISYIAVFAMSGAVSDSGALINKRDIAAVVSFTFSVIIGVITFGGWVVNPVEVARKHHVD